MRCFPQNNNKITFALLTVVLSGLGACSPEINNRGYEIENRDFTKVIPMVSDKKFVEDNYGSPSTMSNFKPEVWYYVSKVTTARSFLAPKVLNQKSYAITFNDSDVVTSIVERNGDEAHEINPVKRATPVAGQRAGVLKEVFGNFGKIASQGSTRR